MLYDISTASIHQILPYELIWGIVRAATYREWMVLCRVSAIFHGPAISELYRTVHLTRYEQAVKCLRTLAASPDKAALVRTFAIDGIAVRPEDLTTFYTIFENVVKTLSGLEHFLFRRTDYHSVPEKFFLEECTFAHLKIVILTLPPITFEHAVHSFINRHHTIEQLYLSSTHDWCTRQLPPLSLSSVNDYLGPPGFVPPSALRSCVISFYNATDFGQPLHSLAQTSFETLERLVIVRFGWSLDMIEEVSRTLPRLVEFTVSTHGVRRAHRLLPKETLLAIGNSLMRFTRLLSFSFSHQIQSPNSEDDRAVVEDWGRSCPSLRRCTLYGKTWVLTEGAWA